MAGGQEYSLNLGLDVLPITTDKDNLPDINRLYNAVKSVARGLDTYTNIISPQEDEWESIGFGYNRVRNATKSYIEVGETVAAGNFVEIYADSGILKIRPCINIVESNRLVSGFVLQPFLVGEIAEVLLAGLNTSLAGLAIGTHYWYYYQYPTSPHIGIISNSVPTGQNYKAYYIGQAISAGVMYCPGFSRLFNLVP